MEAEVVVEEMLVEPDFGVGVEQSLVIVVGHSTAVLHLTDHVPHGRPRHAALHHHISTSQSHIPDLRCRRRRILMN